MSQTSGFEITTCDNPTPLALVFAAKFKRAIRNADYLRELKRHQGCFALSSTEKPQSISIGLNKDALQVKVGIDSDAQFVVLLNFDRPSVSPEIQKRVASPSLSEEVLALLAFPEADWQMAAEAFWQQFSSMAYMPVGITLKTLDSGEELLLGDESSEVVISGPKAELAAVFSGERIFLQALTQGRVQLQGSFQAASILSAATQTLFLGVEI